MKPLVLLLLAGGVMVAAGCSRRSDRGSSTTHLTSAEPTPQPQIVQPLPTTNAGAVVAAGDRDTAQVIQWRIAKDPNLSPVAGAIRITALGNTVTLGGTVDTPEQRTRAEQIAFSALGVERVDDEIVVTNAPRNMGDR
jgi:hypothetical protein